MIFSTIPFAKVPLFDLPTGLYSGRFCTTFS
jgi:hypothetical protein